MDDVARAAITAAGGTVTTVYYNQLALRALLKPAWFAKKGRLLPRPAHPPPKKQPLFDKKGEVPGAGELAAKWVAENLNRERQVHGRKDVGPGNDLQGQEGEQGARVQTYARYFSAPGSDREGAA